MTVTARRAQSSLPTKTRSETTVSYKNPPDLVPDTSSGDDSDEETEERITMSPAEVTEKLGLHRMRDRSWYVHPR